MKENKVEKKKSPEQGLEMARQSLSRVKEIDLTAEEKEKVMEMIRQAKKFEAQKEAAKALNLYLALASFLKEKRKEQEIIENNEVVEYGQKKILYSQTRFLYGIENQIKAQMKIDTEAARGYILGEKNENIEVDKDGNILFLKLEDFGLKNLAHINVLKKLHTLNCSLNEIDDLTGIEDLINLMELDCSWNNLRKMPDLSKLKKLEKLNCSNNNLSSKVIGKLNSQIPSNCKFITEDSIE